MVALLVKSKRDDPVSVSALVTRTREPLADKSPVPVEERLSAARCCVALKVTDAPLPTLSDKFAVAADASASYVKARDVSASESFPVLPANESGVALLKGIAVAGTVGDEKLT